MPAQATDSTALQGPGIYRITCLTNGRSYRCVNGAKGKGLISLALHRHGIPTRSTGDGKRLRDAKKLAAT